MRKGIVVREGLVVLCALLVSLTSLVRGTPADAATPIVCSISVAAVPAGPLLNAPAQASCDRAVTHQLDVVIQTTVSFRYGAVGIGQTNVPLGLGANACPSCTELTASAMTVLAPGVRYNIGAVDMLVGPSGATFKRTSRCTPLFPSNTALCAASTSFQG